MDLTITKVDVNKFGKVLLEIDNRVFTREFDLPSRDVQEQVSYLRDSETFIAYKDKKPVGFLSFKVKGDDVEIKTMVVIPEYQGQGLGQQMMKLIKKLTHNKEVTLVTHPKNSQAIIFYLKCGFEICGFVDDYFGDGEPRLKLQLKKP